MRLSQLSSSLSLLPPSSFMSQAVCGSGTIRTSTISGTATVGSLADHERPASGGASITERMPRSIISRIGCRPLSKSGEPRLRFRPAFLLDAIWLQYGQANTRSRECRRCGNRLLSGLRRIGGLMQRTTR
jgi:hypothetical protein